MFQRQKDASGHTLLELLLVLGITTTLVGMAVPLVSDAVDSLRTAAAARYVAGRVMNSRLDAIKRTADVGLRFEKKEGDYTFRSYLDGNEDGVRTADIHAGIDKAISPPDRLGDNFKDVRFEIVEGLPDADGAPAGDTDGVRIGKARILTMTPRGTATSGTLYIRGRRAQYAVRVLGTTGRTRVLQYDYGRKEWVSR